MKRESHPPGIWGKGGEGGGGGEKEGVEKEQHKRAKTEHNEICRYVHVWNLVSNRHVLTILILHT